MAAEFSRELSAKVYEGQCRLTRMGYRQGGFSGYGVRRMLVDAQGRPKGILEFGQRKSILTDRVILVPGPPEEVAVIKRIFREYVGGKPIRQIVKRLNAEGIANFLGRPWVYGAIRRILVNEKYIGNNVFSHYSQKLRQRTVENPPSEWVRKDSAFKGIVSADVFRKAGEMLKRQHMEPTDEKMLSEVRRIIARDGSVSIRQIDAEPDLMCSQFRRRFGSMRQLYEKVGYRCRVNLDFTLARRSTKGWRESLTAFIVEMIEDSGSSARRDGWLVEVDAAWSLSVVVLQASHYKGRPRWFVRHASMEADIMVFAKMALDGSAPIGYVVLPRLMRGPGAVSIRPINGPSLEAHTFASLAVLRDLARASASGYASCG